jgi:K+ potassium transporter
VASIDARAVYGVASLIVWAIVLVVLVKYVVLIMRAGNNGEGRIMALVSLMDDECGYCDGDRGDTVDGRLVEPQRRDDSGDQSAMLWKGVVGSHTTQSPRRWAIPTSTGCAATEVRVVR